MSFKSILADDGQRPITKAQFVTNLNDKPQCIYNLNETGLQPEHRPPNVIAPLNSKPQAIVSQ